MTYKLGPRCGRPMTGNRAIGKRCGLPEDHPGRCRSTSMMQKRYAKWRARYREARRAERKATVWMPRCMTASEYALWRADAGAASVNQKGLYRVTYPCADCPASHATAMRAVDTGKRGGACNPPRAVRIYVERGIRNFRRRQARRLDSTLVSR